MSLIVATNLQYHRTWLTYFFHGFPHLDFSFSGISATFSPENTKYREALWMWASVPLICCAVFWLLYLIFFLIRCCCNCKATRRRLHKSKRCCPFSGIFLLLECAALGVIMYGNTEIHKGVDNSVHAMKSTKKTVVTSQQIMNTMAQISNNVERKFVPELIVAVSSIGNSTAVSQILAVIQQIGQNINNSVDSIVDVKNSTANKIHADVVAGEVDTVEYIRWVLVIVICCLYMVLFLLLFAALLMKSRKKLILATVLTIVLLPTVWGIASVHLALAVGSGDLCVDPNSFVLTQLNNTVDEELLSVYMECTDKSLPFGKEMLNAQTALSQAMTALNTTVNMSSPYNISHKLAGPVSAIQNDLQSMFGNLSSLNTLVGSCQTLHNQYTLSVQGVCHTALFGVGYVLLSAILMSLCSALLVFCSALAWTSFNKQPLKLIDVSDPFLPPPQPILRYSQSQVDYVHRVRGRDYGYEPVDDTDPFVPILRPHQSHTYGAIHPDSHGEANAFFSDAVSINDGDGPVYSQDLLRETPPASHYSNILEQYTDLAPTPRSIVRAS